MLRVVPPIFNENKVYWIIPVGPMATNVPGSIGSMVPDDITTEPAPLPFVVIISSFCTV